MKFLSANVCLVVLVISLLVSSHIFADATREWTSSDGKKIQAELVNYDGKIVTLRMNSKEYSLPLSKLSAEDQNWLKENAEKEAKELAARLKSIVGLHTKASIEHRYAAATDGYFKGPFGKDLRKFYDQTAAIVDVPKKGVFMDCAKSVAWQGETMTVFCPSTYTGDDTPHGIYINISAGNNPINLRPGYKEVMEKLKIIYASPSGASNHHSDIRRTALVLDTLATLRKTYAIDESRIFVGGTSGGGAMSAMIGVNYPEFRGVLCQVRNFIIPHPMCVPYVEQSDVSKIARRKQAWAWITGPGDSNHDAIVKCSKVFDKDGFVSKLFDVPGMKHEPASGVTLEKALIWAEESSQAPKDK